jgi:hypothetical protein
MKWVDIRRKKERNGSKEGKVVPVLNLLSTTP